MSPPYRTPNEPEPEVLFRAAVSRSMRLLATIFARSSATEVRLERVGGKHRLVFAATDLLISAPFILDGASRMSDLGHVFMRLDVTGANGARAAFAVFASTDQDDADVPILDDWFDGTPLSEESPVGYFMVRGPRLLVELRDALARCVVAD